MATFKLDESTKDQTPQNQ